MALAAVGLALGCGGGGDGEGGAGGVDDGKLHPPGDGTQLDEAAACDELRAALSDVANELGCVSTVRACPNLLEALSGEACATYDGGSVDGCVEHYAGATDCDDITARADECVPEVLGGCPD